MISSNYFSSQSVLSYEQYLNNFQDSENLHYIGPQAIFNPKFVPPINCIRVKQARLIKGIIEDAIQDDFSTNIDIYGPNGMGKNLHVIQYLQWIDLIQNRMLINQEIIEPFVDIIHLNCADKNLSQVYFSLIQKVSQKFDISLDLQQTLLMSPADLWNTFKLITNKMVRPSIFYFQQAEYLEENYLSKILTFAKTKENMQVITSLNTGVQRYSFNNYRSMDHKLSLDPYNHTELYQILKQRSIMAFKNPLEESSLELMANLVHDFEMDVPGAYIRILQAINPLIQQNNQVNAHDLREISQFHFDGFNIDIFQITEYLMETSIEDRLFLDYIINTFQNQTQYFASKPQIHDAYLMSCEELGYSPSNNEFESRLNNILKTNIISSGNFYPKVKKRDSYPKYHPEKYYLTIPLNEAQDILDVVFGEISEHPPKEDFYF